MRYVHAKSVRDIFFGKKIHGIRLKLNFFRAKYVPGFYLQVQNGKTIDNWNNWRRRCQVFRLNAELLADHLLERERTPKKLGSSSGMFSIPWMITAGFSDNMLWSSNKFLK